MIFPIGDDQIIGGHKPIFSYSLIAINIIIFLIDISLSPSAHSQFITEYGAIPYEIVHGQDYFTLLSNIFLHGGWMHLIGNMIFLWVFADNIEAIIGNIPFLFFYIAGGVIASVAHVTFNIDSQIISLGASGAIAAVMGAYLVMFPKSKVKMIVVIFMHTFKIPAYLFLGIWFIQQMFYGVGDLTTNTGQSGGIAWWAHIGGFVFGLIAGFVIRKIYTLNPSISSNKII